MVVSYRMRNIIKKEKKNVSRTQFKLKMQREYVIIKCISVLCISNLETGRDNDRWIVKFSVGRH